MFNDGFPRQVLGFSNLSEVTMVLVSMEGDSLHIPTNVLQLFPPQYTNAHRLFDSFPNLAPHRRPAHSRETLNDARNIEKRLPFRCMHGLHENVDFLQRC